MSFRVRPAIVVIALALLPAAVRQQFDDPAPPAEVPVTGSSAPGLPTVSGRYLEAAAAFRRGDFARSRTLLAPLASAGGAPGATARLVLGLYARDSEALPDAVALLRSATDRSGPLEDWRLLALAETTAALDEVAHAQDTLSILISDFPDSPLQALAIQRAIEIAHEHQSWTIALSRLELARSRRLPLERSREIERLAWEIGAALERPDVQAITARRLLVHHPVLASELGAVELFEQPGGEVDWHRILTLGEIQRRARRLIDSSLPEEALTTLDLVPESERDARWLLLRAEALTGDRKGTSAVEALAELEADDADSQAEIAWQRALAAREAARVRRGRANLSHDHRQQMRAVARENLERAARLTDDQDLAVRALRLLFKDLSDDEGTFDRALEVLGRLQQLEPSDTTGTRYLWDLGWQAYTRRDYPVAIGYWSELGSRYPGSNTARGGRYWTARAHETLGHHTRARAIFREVADADTSDFYSRHARRRLLEDTQASPAIPSHPTEPWPRDPVLERARWLSDLGLDELALIELDGRRAVADERAFWAVEAVILARLGRRRESIQSLARAFTSLGRPHQSAAPDDALRLYYPLDFNDIIELHAKEQGLSPYLVFAMVRQESAFDASARSWAGARGLMQLMPATGRELARRMGLRYSTTRLADPDFSVRLGTSYFRQMLDIFDGNQELALAGYNAGPYRIKKLWRQAGSDPELDRFLEGLNLQETKTYVKRILLFENSYQRLYEKRG